MKVLVIGTSLLLLACACSHRSASGGASSSSATMTGSSAGGQLSSQDARFVREAAQSGLAEVRVGQLAAQNAQDPALKSYGQRLVEDHTKANEELAQIASQKGITLPVQMDSTDQRMVDRLSGASGPEFERMCQKDAIQAHEKAIKQFQAQAENGKDPDLRAFAQKTLPVLQEHLSMAKQMSGGSSGSSSQQ